ncbi:MAG: HTTM domain-containing protein [Planctomycetaceae bacterium]|jgi:hypothetical protein|nr:HTTM domain-containing protein [Planctomycetaceae bacterium]MBT6153415.1 HTTM domain-containing protein [Planctomycetaceae bacterium]MBT6485761.1 HTTM domain-containing protein [Planctomycetaceae bacterium]MBT6494356.1 HTTM domain-containing protein [Planctomycetaceae bacterium]
MSIDQPALTNDQGVRSRFSRFFYSEEVPYGLAIVRILMPLALLVPMLARWSLARELYSTDGAPTPLWFNYGWYNLLPLFSGGVVVAMHTLLIFFLFCSAVGWKTRFSLPAATLLFVYINLCDSVSTITKYSVIASHILLLLSLSHSNAIWSVDAWLKKRKQLRAGERTADAELPRFAIWPQRLMQLMIGIVYFGAAITKMHTPEFFSGEQMQSWLITNVNYNNPIGEYLSLYPASMVFMAYIAIVWEVLFLFLVWRGWGRIAMIGIGTMFHVATCLVLGLYVFPMVCISIYFSFIDERTAIKFGALFSRVREKMGWQFNSAPVAVSTAAPEAGGRFRLPSPIVYCLMMLGVTVFGVELEHRLDRYGVRRPEGPYALKEITDTHLIARMLAAPQPMRTKDMFDTFELGTGFVGGLLFDRRGEFRQGEMIAAQVGLNVPHHDMWLECNLYDSRGNQLDRVGQIVSRETTRANFYYSLNEVLDPGEYFFVLKSGGQEVMRKRIVLKANMKPPVAN